MHEWKRRRKLVRCKGGGGSGPSGPGPSYKTHWITVLHKIAQQARLYQWEAFVLQALKNNGASRQCDGVDSAGVQE